MILAGELLAREPGLARQANTGQIADVGSVPAGWR